MFTPRYSFQYFRFLANKLKTNLKLDVDPRRDDDAFPDVVLSGWSSRKFDKKKNVYISYL